MKLSRRFYNDSINFRNISKKRIVIAIIIGVASAFTIYSFMYLLRECFRLMSHGLGHLPNILSEFERNVYNWFFAAISLVFGNSIAINLILSGAHKGFEKRNFKRRRILNDQTVLNSSFAFLFLKIAYILGIFSMSFTDFNFLPDYTYFIILLLIVLYLETWKSLSLVLGKKRLKWMLLHFCFLFILSFGLSKIDFLNYKRVDVNQLKYTPLLNLPKSENNNVTYYDHYMNVYLDNVSQEKLLFGYYENDINDSYLDFINYKSKLFESFQEKTAIRISANENTKMSIIKTIEKQIKRAGINYIIYATFEDDLNATRFSNSGIKVKLNEFGLFEDNLIKTHYSQKNNFYNVTIDSILKDTLKIKIGKEFVVNGILVSNEELIDKFKRNINKKTIFQYEFKSNTEYQKYITTLSTHLKAAELVRNKNRKVHLIWDNEKFKYKNEKSFLKNEQYLRNEYPIIIFEKFD